MRASDRAALLLAALTLSAACAPAGAPRPEGRGETVPRTVVLLFADAGLYLCPPCGDRFLNDCRRLEGRYGRGNVWIVVSSEMASPDSDPRTGGAAAMKRIRTFLRSSGCRAPVLLDGHGLLGGASRFQKEGLILDPSAGAVARVSPALSAAEKE